MDEQHLHWQQLLFLANSGCIDRDSYDWTEFYLKPTPLTGRPTEEPVEPAPVKFREFL
jgi:hypothetical protein